MNYMDKAQGYRVLVISNGHGEDEIAAVLGEQLSRLAQEIDLEAFPLVGNGRAYLKRGITVVMQGEDLPSGGFSHNSLGNLLMDIKGGLFRQIRDQIRLLKRIRGQIDLAVCVGDVYLLILAGLFLKKPLFFLPTAKSDYIAPHWWVEIGLMRRYAQRIFPRDAVTAASLSRQGLPAEFVGNLMMDCLPFKNPTYFREEGSWVITFLPGSRLEAYENMEDLTAVLAAFENLAVGQEISIGRRYYVALAGGLNITDLVKKLETTGWVLKTPTREEVTNGVGGHLCSQRDKFRVTVVQGRFGDLLAVSDLVLGLAGTGNEQAVGLGKPVVTFPGRGAQFTKGFAERQKRLLGDSICLLERDPVEVAEKVLDILTDPSLQERMGQIGRQRMGVPGGAEKIALRIKEFFSA
jgi:uncharacterized protein (TIGR03492 family)